MSLAQQTESRRLTCVEDALAQAVGETEAARLMRVSEEYDTWLAQTAPEPEPLTNKVRRLRATAKGRERLRRAKTLAEVRFV